MLTLKQLQTKRNKLWQSALLCVMILEREMIGVAVKYDCYAFYEMGNSSNFPLHKKTIGRMHLLFLQQKAYFYNFDGCKDSGAIGTRHFQASKAFVPGIMDLMSKLL